uniref:Major facilitator superfamily (MFS) profile domain-containing protein n=1 Tax=Amphimedon queenslandica TaxID=400682 RepID=A0A1X7TH13_AMPQE
MQYLMGTVLRKESNWHGFSILICAQYIFFPLFGLLADVWIGRYKAILIGIVLCFISWIIIGTCYTVNFIYQFPNPLYWFAYTIVYVFETIGYCSFRANIVQYNIDQLIGASANELNAVIYWHSVPLVLSTMIFELSRCLFNTTEYFVLITFLTSGLAVAVTLVSHSFFKHKLENISLIKNPIKLIVRVLCYARKHKYPENRSALTYWEEEAPSRLDLGKDKYGGPFTEEEVEDVKIFFRMIPLLIVLTGFVISNDYKYIVSTFFSKYVPRILTRLIGGLITALSLHINEMLLVSKILLSLTYSLIVPASLEFTVAQSPVHMRGVMVGLWYASWGIGCFGNIAFKSVLVLIILIVFMILAKRYKYRVRENEVNIVQIVDDHYQRYMEQEEQYYNNQDGLSFSQ